MKRIVLITLIAALLASPAAAQMKTRESVGLEGIFGWFPANSKDLKAAVGKYLTDAGTVAVEGKPIAIIAPHAGYNYAGPTMGYAYKALAGQKYDRVVILAPSHVVGFAGGHIGDWDYYSTPMGSSELDRIACRKLLVSGIVSTQPRADDKEYSIQNQLPFLETVLPDARIVPIIVGGPQTDDNIRKLGDALRSVATPDTLYVVSSDFTHYGERYHYEPYKGAADLKAAVRKGDEAAVDLIAADDLTGFRALMKKRDAPTICGSEAIAVLLRVLEGRKDIRGRLVHYAASGERSGDWSNSVSYAAVVLSRVEGGAEAPMDVTTVVERGPGKDEPEKVPEKLSDEDMKTLLVIAREQLERIVRDKKTIDPRDYRWDIGRKLLAQGATFVTLKNGDNLRGCMGDTMPSKPIYMSVAQNTVNAIRRDKRFAKNPVTAAELPKIEIEVTVLSPFKAVPSYTDIVVGRHGVYMEKDDANAIFLPQVAAEQKWDRDTMLKELCLKAGLKGDAYKEPGCRLWVFEGQSFNEYEMKRKEAEKERPLHWND